MDDATFLRNLAAHGRLALLADGTAVPSPESVIDDESRAGSPFIIDLVSPEGAESGDGRTFEPGSITWRELPLPLMWQWKLDDGHKGAVIVGRIDYIEETPQGLGNARGVFDSGPWGQEAERLVRSKMLRGVSGDYSNFKAEVTPQDTNPIKSEGGGDDEAADDHGTTQLVDDKVNVQESKLVSATLVSKPAFEGCNIRIPDADAGEDADPSFDDLEGDPDDSVYADGVIEASVAITASALVAAGLADMVARLERLEMLEMQLLDDQLVVTASAARARVQQHKLTRDREEAISRVRTRSLIAAAPLSTDFLSNKAKLQPRDKNGRFIQIGAMVRYQASRSSKNFQQGRVTGYDPASRSYTVRDLSTGAETKLPGNSLQVVKALVPSSPDQAKQLAVPETGR